MDRKQNQRVPDENNYRIEKKYQGVGLWKGASKMLCLLMLILTARTAIAQDGQLLFRSGFEAGSTMYRNSYPAMDIKGVDTSVSAPNDWANLDSEPFKRFQFAYQGGPDSVRNVKIVPDPMDSRNQVLRFWYKGPITAPKARIQANLSPEGNFTELYSKSRIYLHPDIKKLETMAEASRWFFIAELWNYTWREPFRISTAIRKEAGVGKKLYFKSQGQTYKDGVAQSPHVFDVKRPDYTIPFGEWLTSEFYYKVGNASTGRYYWALTRENGSKTVMWDITNFTHHPDDSTPGGYGLYSPFKLYTSPENVDHVRNNGGAIQIFWDDWELWTSFPPAVIPTPPTAPKGLKAVKD